MSDVPQTLNLITLAQEFRGDIVKQINRRCIALKTLPIVMSGGQNVAWVPQGDGHIAENYTEAQDASNFGSDEQKSAILLWGLYRSAFHVSKLAMDTAATTSTPMGNQSLWVKNMKDAAQKLADKLEKEIFVGPGSGSTLAGFDVAIGDDTNTYATMARGTYAYWKPTVVDPGSTTSLTFAQARSDMAAIGKACGEKPDLAYVGLATFNSVANLFLPNQRWNKIVTERGLINLEAGMDAVVIDGCQFVPAKDAPEGKIYYVNSRAVEIQVLPDSQFAFASNTMEIVPDDDFGVVPLGMHFEMLAKNGPSERAEILAQCQLVVKRPNMCGVRKNVSYQ